jgi:hypothetical protein
MRIALHPHRTPPLVLRRLPPIRLATPPNSTPTHPTRQDRHHLRMPAMPNPLPRRATLRRLQHLVPPTRARRAMPPLPGSCCGPRPRRRQPIQRHPPRAADPAMTQRAGNQTLMCETMFAEIDHGSRHNPNSLCQGGSMKPPSPCWPTACYKHGSSMRWNPSGRHGSSPEATASGRDVAVRTRSGRFT